ncbi:dynein light chain 1, cytoplasmic-like [Malus sylvestris]|uniref:dynein light chain 1, cytoplasmic-like n=1 Tax=Malus sylvestris TaxID=3752 RepID=UPI0021AC9C96|nr:dynein light chain 1, cytoplasmic-like [Malus sylvestris]
MHFLTDMRVKLSSAKREMERAELELERRSKFLSSLIQKKKSVEEQDHRDSLNVRVRASDMPITLQNRAFRSARDHLDAMPGKLDSKRLALALKKDFDSSYGPAWHCIVGTSFGSYVTHSTGGFLYFSIDKVYVLLFKTAVEPLDH